MMSMKGTCISVCAYVLVPKLSLFRLADESSLEQSAK